MNNLTGQNNFSFQFSYVMLDNMMQRHTFFPFISHDLSSRQKRPVIVNVFFLDCLFVNYFTPYAEMPSTSPNCIAHNIPNWEQYIVSTVASHQKTTDDETWKLPEIVTAAVVSTLPLCLKLGSVARRRRSPPPSPSPIIDPLSSETYDADHNPTAKNA